jgi:hypothetical protein
VIGAMLLWLSQVGALGDFLRDVFQKGPSAKASHPGDFLVRGVRAAWHLLWQFVLACIGLVAFWPAMRRAGRVTADEAPQLNLIAGLTILCVLSIGSGVGATYAGHPILRPFASVAIYLAFLGSGLLVAFYLVQLGRGKLSERESQLCFLAGICFGVTFMVSLSWPATFDLIYPSLALVIAAMLQGSRRNGRSVVYAASAVMIVGMTCEKLTVPAGFHEWMEPPVPTATVASALPELKGMYFPPSVAHLIDTTVTIINQHAAPTDRIFVYPEFALFYTLSHRRYPTVTDSHNIDVVNDEFARSEAQRLLESRPPVIVYYPSPEWSLRADETLWRHGQRSGQRDLIAAVEKLGSEYRLAASFAVPPNDNKVLVYVRP